VGTVTSPIHLSTANFDQPPMLNSPRRLHKFFTPIAAMPPWQNFQTASTQVGRRLAHGVKEGLKLENLPGTVFSVACIYSSYLGFNAAMADPLITMKVVQGLSTIVGGASSAFLFFSMRGAQSPYNGSAWKTWKKAAVSADASTDYFMRAWSFPMAIITHTTQLVNAVAFNRTEQAWQCLVGMPGEILSFVGSYRQARRTKAVEEGREPPNVAEQEKTLLGKAAAHAKEAVISPFGAYLAGRAIDYFQWMDANSLADAHAVECKHHAIKIGFVLATIGITFWKIQKNKGLGLSSVRNLSQGVKNAAENTGASLRHFMASEKEIGERAMRLAASGLVAAMLKTAPEPVKSPNLLAAQWAWHARLNSTSPRP